MRMQIEEFPEYEVCSTGRIWSRINNRYMKSIVESGGRIRVSLRKNGSSYKRPISRLVAITFINNQENKEHVDHIDGDRSNNHVSNLRWVTNQENQDHRDEQGISGANSPGKKIKYGDFEYEGIRQLSRILARERGCLPETARKAIQGARHGEITLYGKKLKFI